MTTTLHAEVERIVGHAREDHARYLEAAALAVQPRRSHRRSNRLAREAGAYAAMAADDIPELVAEVEHLAAEADSAHEHMVRAIRAGWHFKHLADEADCRVQKVEREKTGLLALIDQLRAELADRQS